MKKLLLGAFVLAFWTGRSEYVVTISGKQGINCEYEYVGHKFWQAFVGGICPMKYEVQ